MQVASLIFREFGIGRVTRQKHQSSLKCLQIAASESHRTYGWLANILMSLLSRGIHAEGSHVRYDFVWYQLFCHYMLGGNMGIPSPIQWDTILWMHNGIEWSDKKPRYLVIIGKCKPLYLIISVRTSVASENLTFSWLGATLLRECETTMRISSWASTVTDCHWFAGRWT